MGKRVQSQGRQRVTRRTRLRESTFFREPDRREDRRDRRPGPFKLLPHMAGLDFRSHLTWDNWILMDHLPIGSPNFQPKSPIPFRPNHALMYLTMK